MNSFRKLMFGNIPDTIPVWFMRQAGRYLPGYMKARETMSIKDICINPEVAAEIMKEPVTKVGVDAAIVFFDILLPLESMGISVDFQESVGPLLSGQREADGKLKLNTFDRKMMKYPLNKVIEKFSEHNPETPVIGFAGGPVTLLSYVVANGADRELAMTKKYALRHEASFKENMAKLTEMVIDLLKLQISAGSVAVQIFDSWAGFYSPYQFTNLIKPYLQEIASEITGLTKTIYFTTSGGGLAGPASECGFDFLSVDWRTRLSGIERETGGSVGLQGNLDPAIAASNLESALRESRMILNDISGKEDYIFNLGHGVLPTTDFKTLRYIVEEVHSFRRRS
ncbi:MAG: uroporphyrinogen decarboxylase [Thermoplasmataceae archaeon]